MKSQNDFHNGSNYPHKSTSGMDDHWKRALSVNEFDELKTSLNYTEFKLAREMDVNNELVEKSQHDRRNIIDLERKLNHIIKVQAKKIEELTEQLSQFTGSQETLVKNLRNKFEDYGREINDRDEKVARLRAALAQTQDELEDTMKQRDRYLKELEAADETIKAKDAQIKRMNTELNIAEKTIEEFIT